ncbi:hypothetical protein [Luteimonas arsenica]|uniref:hypothetical protein n=1 Tax=Luteimonas arsenica TaxID=1586242 RepID=UPI001055DB1B|nr:hypothetical protein [Luteimonas arsenica]
MSIERSSSQSSTAEAARSPEGTQEARERPPANREQTDRFRDALDSARQGVQSQPQPKEQGEAKGAIEHGEGEAAELRQTATDDAVHRASDRGERGDGGGHGHDGAEGEAKLLDPALLWQAQHALRGDAPAAMPATVGASNAVVELIERHVRQLAVAGGATDPQGDGQVLLRMADATLPGTDLLLSREGDGWVLRADVRSRASYDAIRDAAPELSRRFAERELGTLRVDPHFHG